MDTSYVGTRRCFSEPLVELRRRQAPRTGVHALTVVPRLDELEDGASRLVAGVPVLVRVSSPSPVAKKLSATALSRELPLRPMLATACFPSSSARSSFETY